MTLSPPSRAVMLVAAALGIELELKTLNLLAMEHKTPEYLAVITQTKFQTETKLTQFVCFFFTLRVD